MLFYLLTINLNVLFFNPTALIAALMDAAASCYQHLNITSSSGVLVETKDGAEGTVDFVHRPRMDANIVLYLLRVSLADCLLLIS